MIEDPIVHVLAFGTLADRCFVGALLAPIASLELVMFLARWRRRDGKQETN